MSAFDPKLDIQRESGQDYSMLLGGIADNLIGLIPSQFMEKDILELERVLNEIYVISYLETWPLNVQNALLDALSRASELNYTIGREGQDKKIDRSFFKTLKQFAQILYMLSAHLEHIESYGPSSI